MNLGQLFTATPEQEAAVAEGKIVFSCMDDTGDTKTIWDPNNQEEVAAARESFNRLTGKGFDCFKVEGAKGSGFDSTEYRVLLYTGTSPMSIDTVWVSWNLTDATTVWTSDTSTSTSITDVTWASWQGTGSSYDFGYNPNDHVQQARHRQRIAEERKRWEETWRRNAAERARKQETALVKSYQLLLQHLTPAQREMLETEGRFLVEVEGGRIYEINRGKHMNVYLLDDRGRRCEQLCCLPRGDIPEGDVMLAQMLHLLHNEKGFRRVANRWELRDFRGNERDRRLRAVGTAIALVA